MRRLFGRETFIALRARRQGHQIARDIIAPPIPPPIEPPQPVSNRAVERFERELKRESWRAQRVKEEAKKDLSLWIIFGSLLFVIFIMIFCLKIANSMR